MKNACHIHNSWISTGDPSAPNVDIEIKAVVLDNTRQVPYRAHIELEKVFYSLGDQQEQSRERWTANLVYGFRNEVPNAMLLTKVSRCRIICIQ